MEEDSAKVSEFVASYKEAVNRLNQAIMAARIAITKARDEAEALRDKGKDLGLSFGDNENMDPRRISYKLDKLKIRGDVYIRTPAVDRYL